MVDNLVSIIMPVHNGAATIGESIESVLSQNYSYWELIVVDDGSTDETKDIIMKYSDRRIRYFFQSKNIGVARARNIGIRISKGRYIAFLDSDDLWLPEKLQCQLEFMYKNHYGFTYTEYRQFTSNPLNPGKLIKIKDFVDYKELLKGNDIGCLTVILDRSIFSNIEMPCEHHEDYITWLSLLKCGHKAYGLHADLARYRKSKQSLTGNKWKSLCWTWAVYRRSQKLSIYRSIKNMCYYVFNGIEKHCR